MQKLLRRIQNLMQRIKMQKFAIFKKTDKFYWTKNRTIYSTFIFFAIIIYINRKLFHIKSIEMIFCIGLAILVFAAFFWSLFGIESPDSLKGTLEGFIIFKSGAIEVADENFPISNLKNIEIFNDDYYGKKLRLANKGDFNSTLSNGVNNKIILTFISNSQKIYYFQLLDSNDFQKVRAELIEYYKQRKMTFENICTVLGEQSIEEIEKFKLELSK
jgi:hypothetical protein